MRSARIACIDRTYFPSPCILLVQIRNKCPRKESDRPDRHNGKENEACNKIGIIEIKIKCN